jgi:hypothetical protein
MESSPHHASSWTQSPRPGGVAQARRIPATRRDHGKARRAVSEGGSDDGPDPGSRRARRDGPVPS